MHLHTLGPWMFLAAAVLGAIYLLIPVGRARRDDP
jgi:hypothetical protein